MENIFAGLPPGTILQLMYIQERISLLTPGRFIEIGPGSGEITQLLLNLGWVGQSYDLESSTILHLQQRFATEIKEAKYQPLNEDFLATSIADENKADLVISCMVVEHLDDDNELNFLAKVKSCLKPSGQMITLVPSSPSHWGIEDDIAGHYRRYTREKIQSLLSGDNWRLDHLKGLTYPVSNILLPISNYLVKKEESKKLDMTLLERTKQSGNRNVKYKTHYPKILKVILNRYSLLPFHLLQKCCSDSGSTLVLYFEAKPESNKR